MPPPDQTTPRLDPAAPAANNGARDLTMPRLSDSMTEGTILKWLVREGEEFQAGQPLVEIETDKATVTHEAEDAGTVLALVADEGASVAVGAPIALVAAPGAQGGEAGASRPTAPTVPAGPAAGTASARASGTATPERVKASPLARRLAARAGVELVGLPGSGPQGRVIRADVERAMAGTAGAPAPSSAAQPDIAEVHELTRLQRTVARRMSESRATVPDIELRREIDMAECVNLRARLGAQTDPLPTYNDFIVKAAALSLREFPRVNSRYREDRFEHLPRINVGIAVAAEDALLVPTIFDADHKSLGQIAAEARTLAARAREGTIEPAELDGASFTVSNLGMHGVDSFSAIINPPQAAILTVGSLRPRPVVDASGEVVARPTLVLSLACDHRILYGADGARFLARIAAYLEQPLTLLLS